MWTIQSAFEKFSPTLKFSYDIKDKKTFFVIFIFLNRMFSFFYIEEIAAPIIL